jgi:hypothetical protein
LGFLGNEFETAEPAANRRGIEVRTGGLFANLNYRIKSQRACTVAATGAGGDACYGLAHTNAIILNSGAVLVDVGVGANFTLDLNGAELPNVVGEDQFVLTANYSPVVVGGIEPFDVGLVSTAPVAVVQTWNRLLDVRDAADTGQAT